MQSSVHANPIPNGAALAAAVLSAMLLAQPVHAAQSEAPTVLELFQSQGCSSCPPAAANLNARADRPDLLALSYGVTYWDGLGWKDTFAKPEFTARQWAYAHGMHRDLIGTPEMVVNGQVDLVGDDGAALDAAISRVPPPDRVAVRVGPDEVSIAAASAERNVTGRADVWLVRYDPGVRFVAVGQGENGGKTLPHRDVVRELIRLGTWTGAAARFHLPPSSDPTLRTAVLVQAPGGGPILGAGRS
jgi:hypothetical protein